MIAASDLTNSRSKKIKEPKGRKARFNARKDFKGEVKGDIPSANENYTENSDEPRSNKLG